MVSIDIPILSSIWDFVYTLLLITLSIILILTYLGLQAGFIYIYYRLYKFVSINLKKLIDWLRLKEDSFLTRLLGD